MAIYVDHGSVEGRLEATPHNEAQRFIIHESVWGEPIECEVSDGLLAKALGCLGKRVEVYGPIRYGKDGTPLSVIAEEIIPFPDPRDIPSYEDVKGILAAYE